MAAAVLTRLILPIYLPSLAVAMGQQASMILLPLYVLELGGSPAAAATVAGLRAVGTLVANVPAGMLTARLGARRVMLLSLLVVCLGLGAFAGLGSVWGVGVAALAFGAGVGGWFLTRVAWIAEDVVIGERGRAIAVMAGIQRAGSLVGPLAGGVLAQRLGFDVAFMAAAALAAVGAACVALFMRGGGSTVAIDGPRPRILAVVAEHRRVLATAGGAAVGLQLMRTARQLLIPLWGASIGLSTEAIGALWALAASVDMIMFYPVGWVMDRYGRRSTAIPCMALMALSLALLPLAADELLLTLVALLGGFANGLGTGIVATLGADLAPPHQRGEFLGVWRLVGDTGGAGGPFVVGSLASVAGLGGAALACAGIGLVGLAVMVLLVRETLIRADPSSARAP